MELNKQDYLKQVLDTHRMAHIETLVNKHKQKSNEIKLALKNHYESAVYTSFDSGSFGKHTAINTKFDLDIVIPFKKDSFSTIENMYNDIFEFLEEKYKGIAAIRKQKVSIGVIFNQDKDGDIISIDVVPGRELNQDDYLTSRDLNLYFNEDHWGYSKGSYTKTNIQSQIDHIKSKNNERKIIRLLKIWKNANNENYKSFLLELLTIKAFNNNNITGNVWEMLRQVLNYISDNINSDNFTLKDPGNSNNDLVKKMSSVDRCNLSYRMSVIIERIEDNSQNLKLYFPVNDNYVDQNKSENSYGIKTGVSNFSTPPNNERFG